MKRMLLLGFLAVPGAVLARDEALPLSADSRIETLLYKRDADFVVRTAVGSEVAIVFAPGEQVQSVTIGDSGAFSVAVPPQADSLFVRALRPAGDTGLTVRSQLRNYSFILRQGAANDVHYLVRFGFMAPPLAKPQPAPRSGAVPQQVGSYLVKGAAALRPLSLSDDGERTYLTWGEDQALPAVFALNALGEEETVDGYMRDGIFTIDRVYPALIFRIGKVNARATRKLGAVAADE